MTKEKKSVLTYRIEADIPSNGCTKEVMEAVKDRYEHIQGAHPRVRSVGKWTSSRMSILVEFPDPLWHESDILKALQKTGKLSDKKQYLVNNIAITRIENEDEKARADLEGLLAKETQKSTELAKKLDEKERYHAGLEELWSKELEMKKGEVDEIGKERDFYKEKCELYERVDKLKERVIAELSVYLNELAPDRKETETILKMMEPELTAASGGSTLERRALEKITEDAAKLMGKLERNYARSARKRFKEYDGTIPVVGAELPDEQIILYFPPTTEGSSFEQEIVSHLVGDSTAEPLIEHTGQYTMITVERNRAAMRVLHNTTSGLKRLFAKYGTGLEAMHVKE